MNQKQLVIFLVFIVVMIASTGYAYHYFFGSKAMLDIPELETTRIAQNKQTAFSSDLFAITMEKIKSEKERQDMLLSAVKRNPFLWPEKFAGIATNADAAIAGAKNTSATVENGLSDATPPKPEAPEFSLSMVIVGDKKNIALVNNQFVSEGSRISGYDVLKISPNSIMLASGGDRKSLSLSPANTPLQKLCSKKQEKSTRSANKGSYDYQAPLKKVLKDYNMMNVDSILNPNMRIN
ncbi:hypothetical protein [Desulfobacula phenolica]|uniref:Uncharacterized protein n=1 Tax=Desulfobacula phenolica TaxID=90732 RepID=A0A1H2J0B0_9BACT|nr:hypothetical protein [Desulfobacula phenolica]SDU49897.1 hypothetical protein SAMN04487931_11062 [Desulfobacula phenolica]